MKQPQTFGWSTNHDHSNNSLFWATQTQIPQDRNLSTTPIYYIVQSLVKRKQVHTSHAQPTKYKNLCHENIHIHPIKTTHNHRNSLIETHPNCHKPTHHAHGVTHRSNHHRLINGPPHPQNPIAWPTTIGLSTIHHIHSNPPPPPQQLAT